MGIYYKTYYYKNIEDKNIFYVLAHTDRILDSGDIERGYVKKEDLFQYYSSQIKPEDITEKSYIVEYVLTTYEPSSELQETRRLPVY